tara:strand:+ start:244 stop:567 length:324 start_codon:yes stop_codon:yes gene_type:complete
LTSEPHRDTIHYKQLGNHKEILKMFGIIEKMQRFSNNRMTEDEKIDFMQEIVDNGMVWDMHEKYRNEAKALMGAGKVVNLAIRRKVKNPAPVLDADGRDPFDVSICH